ncbi:MAG: lipopolysaccharide biosynthesis protein [Thermoleophilia bacterium]|nr:lipopolysaccharide biosynthesis protein [Thermoleophilia bacterium]
MDERAVRGVPWTLLSYGVNRGVLVLTTVGLARILQPDDYGLVALATVALTFLALVKDLGLGGTLIVRGDLDADARGTVLTLMVGSGLLLAIVAAACAPLLADVFDEPRLTGVLAALSTMLLIGGFSGFYEALMQREMEFRGRFYALLAQALAIAAVSFGLAIAGAGVWSLVVGQIAGLVVFSIALYVLTPERVPPRFRREAARDAIRTGSGFLVQSGTVFVRQNADYVVVGHAFGSATLGVYSMAYRLGDLPYQAVADPVARVTFPTFARLRERGGEVGPQFGTVVRLVALVTVPLGAGLSALAEPFTLVIFGDHWKPMIGVLAVLGLWAAVRPAEATLAWLANSLGRAGVAGLISTLILLPLLPALVLAATFAGPVAIAWVVLGDTVLSLVLLLILLQRHGLVSVRTTAVAVWPAVVAGVPVWVAARLVAESGLPPGGALLLGIAAGALVYVAALAVLGRGILKDSVAQVMRIFGRGPARTQGAGAGRP